MTTLELTFNEKCEVKHALENTIREYKELIEAEKSACLKNKRLYIGRYVEQMEVCEQVLVKLK